MVDPLEVAQILLIKDMRRCALSLGLLPIGGDSPENVLVRYDYHE
jgi:hypothetical protein